MRMQVPKLRKERSHPETAKRSDHSHRVLLKTVPRQDSARLSGQDSNCRSSSHGVKLFLLAALSSCLHAPLPRTLPQADIDRARETRWHDPYLSEPHSYEEIESHVIEWMEIEGVRWAEKSEGWGKWSRSATAFCNTVVLPRGFWDRKIQDRVRTEVHELVHVRQCREFGQFVFGVRYADQGARWSLEANADIEGLRALVSAGASDEHLAAVAEHEATQLHEYYELSEFPREHIDSVTISLYMDAIKEAK